MGLFGKPQGQACYKCGKLERCWLKCHFCSRVVCQECSINVPAGERVVCNECDEKRADDYHQKKYAQYVNEQESMRNYLARRKQRYSRD